MMAPTKTSKTYLSWLMNDTRKKSVVKMSARPTMPETCRTKENTSKKKIDEIKMIKRKEICES